MITLLRRLVPDPFILVLTGTVILASLLPARGHFATVADVFTTAAIVLLFFLHGVRLSRDAVIGALLHWRLHLTILAATFLVFPLIGLGFAAVVPGLLPQPLWIGVLFLCALPSTVQSSIAFTSVAGGNVAGAVAAAAASNLLGVLITPFLTGLLTDVQGSQVPLSGIGKLMLELVLPFALGQLSRPWLGEWAGRNKRLLSFTDRGTIVLAVYSAFSAAVVGGIWRRLDAVELAVLIGVCAVILLIILLVTAFGSRLLGFNREDRITILFVGSKKTLASGVPIARVLFTGADMGAVLLPIMIFHQMQLMVCAWIASWLAQRGKVAANPR